MKEKQVLRKTVTAQDAAEIYGLSIGHLANLRSRGLGARWYQIGRASCRERV